MGRLRKGKTNNFLSKLQVHAKEIRKEQTAFQRERLWRIEREGKREREEKREKKVLFHDI